jgi:hypothetical protein
LSEATSDALEVSGGAKAEPAPAKGGVDVGLTAYFALWYLGNYYVSFGMRLKDVRFKKRVVHNDD